MMIDFEDVGNFSVTHETQSHACEANVDNRGWNALFALFAREHGAAKWEGVVTIFSRGHVERRRRNVKREDSICIAC